MTKYPQKVIMKIYYHKHNHKWTEIQLTNDKSINKMCNNNGNKRKDIKNNNKTYKTSLLTPMINKKTEMRKCKSNTPQLKQSQTDPNQLIH